MMRLGLVGVGAWGNRYIATIARRTDCRLAAVARGSDQSTVSFTNTQQVTDWRALLDLTRCGQLDGIIVATQPEHQYEVAVAAVEAGVPILVEKPLGTRVQQIDRLLTLHKNASNPAPIVVDYIHLFAPAYAELKRRVQDASSKDAIVSIESTGCHLGPFRKWSPLHDWGVHDVALAVDLAGLEREVDVRLAQRVTAQEPGELFDVLLQVGEISAKLHFGSGSATKIRCLAVCLQSGRRLVYDDTRPGENKLTDAGIPVPVSPVPALDGALEFFIECLRFNSAGNILPKHVCADLRFSRRVMSVLDAIQQRLGSALSD
jgi:predicted dehydrogenase